MDGIVTGVGTGVNFCFGIWDRTQPCRDTVDILQVNLQHLQYLRRTLVASKIRMTEQIITGERIGKTPLNAVSGWLLTVDARETQINEILGPEDDGQPIQTLLPPTCCNGCCYTNFCSSYNLARRVAEMCILVEKDIAAGQFDSIFNPDRELDEIAFREDFLVGIDDKFGEAWSFLEQGDSGSILQIFGMGGVGKSALLKKIYRQLQVDLGVRFDRVVFVEMSNAEDISSARLAIARKLGHTLSEEDLLPAHIYNALAGKRFTLLLDDLRKPLDLGAVGVPANSGIPDQYSKIIFTTKFPNMGQMSADRLIELQCLQENDCWILFERNVTRETIFESHSDIPQHARNLVKFCEGLPLAITTLGASMSGKTDANDWIVATRRLEISRNFPGVDKVYEVLKVSYDNLVHETCKACFLFAALFPKDSSEEVEQMINYWIADGILNHFDLPDDNIAHGRSVIASLERAYLLIQRKGSNVVRMHEMVRGAALSLAKDKFFVRSGEKLHELKFRNSSPATVEKISLVNNSIIRLTEQDFPMLSTFILKNCIVEVIDAGCFKSMPCLRVLDLSGSNILNFPVDIVELTMLQYLNLSHTSISQLPNELRKLKELKILDISFLDSLEMIPTGVLAELSNLQSLNMYHSGFREVAQLPEDDSECNVLFADSEEVLIEVEKLRHIRNLGVTVRTIKAIEKLMSFDRFKWIHSLFITKCEKLALLEVPSLDAMMNLKVFRLHKCYDLEDITINWTDNDANNDHMRAAPTTRSMERFFRNLCDVEIEGCWKLSQVTWLRYATMLRVLKISNCYKIVCLISDAAGSNGHSSINDAAGTNGNTGSNGHVGTNGNAATNGRVGGNGLMGKNGDAGTNGNTGGNGDEGINGNAGVNDGFEINQSIFPHLRSIFLAHLPELKIFFLHNNLTIPLPCLEEITVLYCPKIERLPLNAVNAQQALKAIRGHKIWWDKLTWDDENTKLALSPLCKFEHGGHEAGQYS